MFFNVADLFLSGLVMSIIRVCQFFHHECRGRYHILRCGPRSLDNLPKRDVSDRSMVAHVSAISCFVMETGSVIAPLSRLNETPFKRPQIPRSGFQHNIRNPATERFAKIDDSEAQNAGMYKSEDFESRAERGQVRAGHAVGQGTIVVRKDIEISKTQAEWPRSVGFSNRLRMCSVTR